MRPLPTANSWKGQSAVIIGGGPSLRDFHWPVLKETFNVVAINSAVFKVPTADVFFTEDARWIAKFGHRQEFIDFKGSKVVHVLDDAYMGQLGPFLNDLVLIRKTRNDKFWSKSLDEGLSVSSNSAVGAVNLAEILGASTIYLLGMDCSECGKDVNFHNEYPPEWRAGRHQLESFRSDWELWVKPKSSARIVNVVNPKVPSKLTCFEAITFDEFYSMNAKGVAARL